MSTLLLDLRLVRRRLLRRPGFTATALLTLALGIGANTAMFSVFHTVLLRPLPFDEPERLVLVWNRYDNLGQPRTSLSPPDYMDRRDSDVFESAAAHAQDRVALTGAGDPEQITVTYATASLFPTLRVEADRGRVFSPVEDAPGTEKVTVISHALRQRAFGGRESWQGTGGKDPVIGRRIVLDGEPHTVLGVMPPGFDYPGSTDAWIPIAFTPDDLAVTERGSEFLTMVARLAPGASLAQAQAEMDAIAARVPELAARAGYPNAREFLLNAGWGARVDALHELLVADVRPALLVLAGAVALLLLVACANLAHLLMAHALGRRREIAVRAALGARRGHVVRQMLLESSALALTGGLTGLMLAVWGTEALLRFEPGRLPRLEELAFDLPVFGFTLAASLLTGLLFGALPTLRVSRPDLHTALQGSGTGGDRGSRDRWRGGLVVAEVALALLLLVGAGLLLRSFQSLLRVDPGFQPENVLTVQMSLPAKEYGAEERLAFHRRLRREVEALPGVEAVGSIQILPLSGGVWSRAFTVEGREVTEGLSSDYRVISPGYLEAMGIPILEGRGFTLRDDERAPRVAVVDESLARRFWPGETAIGRRIGFFDGENETPVYREIVGVVRQVRSSRLDTAGGADSQRVQIYIPYAERPLGSFTLTVRTATAPTALKELVRRTVHALDPDLVVSHLRTMDEVVHGSLARQRFQTLLLGVFAGLAVVLAAVGLYGVMAYSVRQRRREVGIRMALGARLGDVMRSVLREGMVLVAWGLALGLLAAWGLTRLLSTLLSGLLYEVPATDPWTWLGGAVLLALVALLACWLPARRAARVDPATALRWD